MYSGGNPLSDATKISGQPWSELKEHAMEPDYMEKSLFVSANN